MAFPTTSVLDTFNRTDSWPLDGNWSVMSGYNGNIPAQLLGNAVAGTNAADDSSDYWTPATFGADTEAFITVSTLPASGEMVALWVRVANPTDSPTFTGYAIRFKQNGDGAGHDQILFIRYDPGPVPTVSQTSTLGANFSAGQQFGVSIVGTVITAYRAGTSIATYDTAGDATKYSAAGNIGFTIRNNTAILDSFGGGTVVVASPAATGGGMHGNPNDPAIRMYYD